MRLALHLTGRVLKSPTFLIVVLIGATATGFFALKTRAIYRSEVVLLYQDRAGSNPVAQRESLSARKAGSLLQETLFSSALLEKLITEFGLYKKAVARYGMAAGIEEMEKKDLRFVNAREGSTFRISFESTSPEQAQSVTARAAQLLLQSRLDAQVKESQEIQTFLESEKLRAEKELQRRESELNLLLAQHPEVVETNLGRGGAVLLDSGPAPDTASLGYEMQALQLRERLDQIRRNPGSATTALRPGLPSEVNEARVRAEAEVAAAQRELADKQAQFTEEYPDVKRAAMRLATAKALLKRVEEHSSSTPQAAGHAPSPQPSGEPGADQPEVRYLQQQIELVEKQARAARPRSRRSLPRETGNSNPQAMAEVRGKYIELDRRARESREHLVLLENRHFMVEMQALFTSQGKQGDLVVVDPANKPATPIRSARSKVLLLGLAGTLALALLIGAFRTLKDDRLRSAEDLYRFGLPALLCEVPTPKD